MDFGIKLEKDAYNPGETARGTLLINADKKMSKHGNSFLQHMVKRGMRRGAVDTAKVGLKSMINKTYHLANAVSPEDFRIVYEEEQLNSNNFTVQALVIANIADEILREYGDAYDIDFDLTDMSNMLITNRISAHGEKRHSNNLENSEDNDELVLVNIWNYQSAQALSGKAVEVFEGNLRPLTQVDNNSSNSDIAYITKVENSLMELNNLLNNKKALPENLMEIVHTQIHPSLQLAYNLESRE
jgi:hypothetical protein